MKYAHVCNCSAWLACCPAAFHCLSALLLQTTAFVPGEVRQPTTAAASPADLDADVLIELHNVHKSFGKKQILRGTNIKVRRGEAVGIIGGSGTGKSTTLRLMAGLLMPDKVQFCGKNCLQWLAVHARPGSIAGLMPNAMQAHCCRFGLGTLHQLVLQSLWAALGTASAVAVPSHAICTAMCSLASA